MLVFLRLHIPRKISSFLQSIFLKNVVAKCSGNNAHLRRLRLLVVLVFPLHVEIVERHTLCDFVDLFLYTVSRHIRDTVYESSQSPNFFSQTNGIAMIKAPRILEQEKIDADAVAYWIKLYKQLPQLGKTPLINYVADADVPESRH